MASVFDVIEQVELDLVVSAKDDRQAIGRLMVMAEWCTETANTLRHSILNAP